jgi:hypothetical protein
MRTRRPRRRTTKGYKLQWRPATADSIYSLETNTSWDIPSCEHTGPTAAA